MTLKIEKKADSQPTEIRLIGQIECDVLGTLKEELQDSNSATILDLEEVTLVDVDAIRFLRDCEIEGMSIRNCSQYIRNWIQLERGRVTRDDDLRGQ
jgi:hypothetical protein